MNDDDIRDLLNRAAPVSPGLDANSRSSAVATRGRVVRRRQRVAVAVMAAVAVVAVGVAVPLLTSGDDAGADRAPVATDTANTRTAVRWCEATKRRYYHERGEGADTYKGAPADFKPVSALVCTWIDGLNANYKGPQYGRDAGPIADPALLWRDLLAHESPSSHEDSGCIAGTMNIVMHDAEGRRVLLQGNPCGERFFSLARMVFYGIGSDGSAEIDAALGGRR